MIPSINQTPSAIHAPYKEQSSAIFSNKIFMQPFQIASGSLNARVQILATAAVSSTSGPYMGLISSQIIPSSTKLFLSHRNPQKKIDFFRNSLWLEKPMILELHSI